MERRTTGRRGIVAALLAAVMALALLPTQALAAWRTYYGEAKFYDVLPSGTEVLVGTQSFEYREETDRGWDEWPSWAQLDMSPNYYWSTAPNPDQHPGYTFVGWRYNNDVIKIGSWESQQNAMDTNSYPNLYAVWEKNTYTVTFDTGEGGSAVEPQEIDKANPTPATKPADPTREGYRFDGWVDGACAPFDFSTTITADTTVIAMWVKTQTVTFDTGEGGSTVAPQTVDKNGTAAKPATDPTREGYDFLGWFDENGEEYDFSTPVTADVALTAKWSEQVFDLSVDAPEVSFDDAKVGYAPVAAQVVTFTNTGNQPLTIASIEVPEGFEFTVGARTRATGYGTLEPGDSLDIEVRPADGLEPGNYEGDLVVTTDEGTVTRIALAFNVAKADDPADDPAQGGTPSDGKPAGTTPADQGAKPAATPAKPATAKPAKAANSATSVVPATGDPATAAGLAALLGATALGTGATRRRRG